jgi:hypothetical protein
MTDENNRISYGTHEILDTARTVEIYGVELARVTTEKPDLVRWTEITLWRYQPQASADQSAPEERYLFQVVAKSLVYHTAQERAEGKLSSRCGKGVATPARELAGFGTEPGDYDAQPCPDCHPVDLDDLSGDDIVFVEKDWPRVALCADAADVRTKLAEHGGKRPPVPGEAPTLNHPSQRLLEMAALLDPAFRADKMIDRL